MGNNSEMKKVLKHWADKSSQGELFDDVLVCPRSSCWSFTSEESD